MRGRMPFPDPILQMAITVMMIAYLASLVPTCFRKTDREGSAVPAKEAMPTVRMDEQHGTFVEPPVNATGAAKLKTKFVEVGSGTEELGFEWIVAPFSIGKETGGPDIPALLGAIECDRRDMTEPMQKAVDTETKDQMNHSPIGFEVVPIVMRNPGEGYHGPTKGSYIFIVEEYSGAEAAAKRAAEYVNPGCRQRIANPDSLEEDGKSSVRCWGTSNGNFAYLLTTHAFSFRALEGLTHDLERKLTAHIGK